MPIDSDVKRRQAEILEKMDKMMLKVEAVAKEVGQVATEGRETRNEVNMLRRELGVDGQHGRIPQIEKNQEALDARMKTMQEVFEIRLKTQQECIDVLQKGNSFTSGVKYAVTFLISAATSSGAVFAYEMMKARH